VDWPTVDLKFRLMNEEGMLQYLIKSKYVKIKNQTIGKVEEKKTGHSFFVRPNESEPLQLWHLPFFVLMKVSSFNYGTFQLNNGEKI
jgi:hypothetical protein